MIRLDSFFSLRYFNDLLPGVSALCLLLPLSLPHCHCQLSFICLLSDNTLFHCIPTFPSSISHFFWLHLYACLLLLLSFRMWNILMFWASSARRVELLAQRHRFAAARAVSNVLHWWTSLHFDHHLHERRSTFRKTYHDFLVLQAGESRWLELGIHRSWSYQWCSLYNICS